MQDANDATAALIERIRVLSPDFERVYAEHVEFNEEVLSFVLFDEWSRLAIETLQAGDEAVFNEWVRVLEEALSSGDETAATLIRTSFLETVDSIWRDAVHPGVVARLTPRLRAGLSVNPQ